MVTNEATPTADGATLVVPRDWATLVAEGPDGRSWLNGLVTCDVGSLSPGTGTWGLVLQRTGKIQSFLVVAYEADRLWLGVAPERSADVFSFFDERLIMEDVELSQCGDERRWLSLHGPEAAIAGEALAKSAGTALVTMSWTHGGDAALVVPGEFVDRLTREQVGKLGRDVVLAGEPEWEQRRVHDGFPWLGADFDATSNPHDASLERRSISWTKGCYVGQEVVCMQDMRGKAKRRIVLLETAHSSPPVGADVSDSAGAVVGSVTSSARPDAAGRGRSLASVRASHADVGTELEVAGLRAQIVAPSF